jgi:predicted GH43/DUF377 family glycosyl hydrolase
VQVTKYGETETLFTRYVNNPILTCDHFSGVNVAFNPAAAMVGDTTVLLVRVEDRRGLSHLHVARSSDGFSNWEIAPTPAMSPVAGDLRGEWGYEDARTVWVEELDQFVITCTAYGSAGPSVHLALTKDFVDFEHIGTVMPPEDKNASLFPRRIDGNWVLLHRPVTVTGRTADVWLSRSADLVSWRSPEPVMSCRAGGWWDAIRIGVGPPPIETEHGWLIIYHGVKTTVSGQIYRIGAALLDINNPTVVLHRTDQWLMGPRAPYELMGDVANVVFPCGATITETGELRLYYGAADTSVCVATCRLVDLIEVVRNSPSG